MTAERHPRRTANAPMARRPGSVEASLRTRLAPIGRLIRRRPFLTSLAVVLVVVALCIAFVDRPLADYYRHASRPETVIFFKELAWLGVATPYLVGLAAVLIALRVVGYFNLYQASQRRLRRLTDACVFIVLSICLSGAILHTIKFVIGRYRPRAYLDNGIYDVAHFTLGYQNSSFPSGHSQLIWSLATALILVYPRYDLAYVVIALVVSYGRVVTGDHYLSDVVFGSYLGIASALFLKARLYDRQQIPVRLR